MAKHDPRRPYSTYAQLTPAGSAAIDGLIRTRGGCLEAAGWLGRTHGITIGKNLLAVLRRYDTARYSLKCGGAAESVKGLAGVCEMSVAEFVEPTDDWLGGELWRYPPDQWRRLCGSWHQATRLLTHPVFPAADDRAFVATAAAYDAVMAMAYCEGSRPTPAQVAVAHGCGLALTAEYRDSPLAAEWRAKVLHNALTRGFDDPQLFSPLANESCAADFADAITAQLWEAAAVAEIGSNKADESSPNRAVAAEQHGCVVRAFGHAGDLPRMRRAYDAAVERYPGEIRLHYWSGLWEALRGTNRNRAERHLRSAVGLATAGPSCEADVGRLAVIFAQRLFPDGRADDRPWHGADGLDPDLACDDAFWLKMKSFVPLKLAGPIDRRRRQFGLPGVCQLALP